jgi:hypothetical protein
VKVGREAGHRRSPCERLPWWSPDGRPTVFVLWAVEGGHGSAACTAGTSRRPFSVSRRDDDVLRRHHSAPSHPL